VVFGRGEACPDEAVTRFLAEGALPPTRVTVCNGLVAEAYVRNALPAAADYRTALQLMTSLDDQIENSDDYSYRLDADPIVMGCDFGGTLAYSPVDGGTALTMDRCAFTAGLGASGTGRIADDGSVRLDVRLPVGVLHFRRDADGNPSVSGTFRGQPLFAARP
jgi:hypothetical protein